MTMVMNYSPSIADMQAMPDGETLVELPLPYGRYYARMATGATWAELTDGLPIWEKGGRWWRQKGSGLVLSVTELRCTRKWLYPCLTDKTLHNYLEAMENNND